MCKQLLKLFGFPFHVAPGEAEAECALLQREGMVDAVLSEDVDTLMFGCGLTLRNWSSEGQKGNKSPTHVSVYDAKDTKQGKSGLDREGMVLVALMSGGDYITEGIPGAGIKVACEAARAGFGKSLCQLSRSNADGIESWRNNLSHELLTNENKFFRCKHKSLKIPDTFPNTEVLAYYTHPVVSSTSKLQKLREEICWDGDMDIAGLRLFVSEAFDWTNKIGATKFIRGLAPALLVHKLRTRGDRRDSGYGDLILTAMDEMQLVRAICGKRTHFSTDGIPELRVIYHPNDIVGLDLDAEEDDIEDYGRDGLAPLNEDDTIEAYSSDAPVEQSVSPTKRGPSMYDPTQPDKLWISETIAKLGIPLKVEDYEESLLNPRKLLKAKDVARKAASKRTRSTKGGMPVGALDKYVKVSKFGVKNVLKNSDVITISDVTPRETIPPSSFLDSTSEAVRVSHSYSVTVESSTDNRTSWPTRTSARIGKISQLSSNTAILKSRKRSLENANSSMNPWTLANPSTSNQVGPSVTKNISQNDRKKNPLPPIIPTPSFVHSSPPVPPTSHFRKNVYSPLPSNDESDISISLEGADTHRLLPSTSPVDSESLSSQMRVALLRSPIRNSFTQESLTPSTPKTVNRRIDFISESREHKSPQNLPLLEVPLFPEQLVVLDEKENTMLEAIEILSSPEIPLTSRINMSPRRPPKSPTKMQEEKPKEAKKYIMLRESLPGQWSMAQEARVVEENRRAWRVSQVEYLDLTSI